MHNMHQTRYMDRPCIRRRTAEANDVLRRRVALDTIDHSSSSDDVVEGDLLRYLGLKQTCL